VSYDHDLADRIRELLATDRGVIEQPMFGGLAFLVNGNMSVAASRNGGLLARVDPDDVGQLIDELVAPAILAGKERIGWLTVAEPAVTTDEALAEWVHRSVAYARSLPPKKGR
jgi:hypothetical protein